MKNNNIFKSSFVLFAHFITKSICHFSVVARLTIGRDLNEFIKMKHTSQVLKELTDFIFVAFQTQINKRTFNFKAYGPGIGGGTIYTVCHSFI